MNYKNLFLAIAMFNFGQLYSQENSVEKRIYTTSKIGNQEEPKIDGLLNDGIWNIVDWNDNFIQHRPTEGAAPSQDTKFKIIYNDSYIYVAFKCYDNNPDSIVKRLSRRDGFAGDWVNISFDSYHDLRSCYSYNVTVAGVKGDEFLSNDGDNSDDSYNPIWYTKTNIDQEGWTAEMKIPLSQLRFIEAEDQVWGLQVMRKLFRKDERSHWQRIPLGAAGWVSQYGELHGLKNLKPKRQIEIQPYGLAQYNSYTKEEGNPFRTGSNSNFSGGLDGKVGISNALTLDFTINPDFGQVEADPAAITLDGFQIFFREQRPFFIENRNIFAFDVSRSEAGNTFGNDNLFYSRRIGKNPSGYPSLENGEYTSIPRNTTILGAAKVSGRTSNGWSIGILESMTDKEYASIDLDGTKRNEIVEPLSNYFVARAQKDYNDANTSVGGIVTSTARKIEGNLNFLHETATTGGLDFRHLWKDKVWIASGKVIASHVTGSKESITETQESLRHLFNRIDASHLSVDTTATSLTGTAGNFKIGKFGSGKFIFESGVAWRSPELELNDIGFMRQADDIRHFSWAGYRWRKPFSIFNSASINYNHWVSYDFEGNLNSLAWNGNTHFNFKNQWNIGLGTNITPLFYSVSELRGGPRYLYAPSHNIWWYASSDYRKKLQAGTNGTFVWGNSDSQRFSYQSAWVRYQPINSLSIEVDASYNIGYNRLQYVSNVIDNESLENKYIQSKILRETISTSLRLNYTINPNLTLQYYGEPYITSGKYSNFKVMKNPTAKDYFEKFDLITDEQLDYSSQNQEYIVDRNENEETDFTFSNPDFLYFQFRSNFVLRWEYKPGSEFYIVWSQGNSQTGLDRQKIYDRLSDEFSDRDSENTFLLKVTYRMSL